MKTSKPDYKSESYDDFLHAFKEWLGYDGTAFVLMLYEEYGSGWETACWVESHEYNLPHSVHFREGMQIRNYMRRWPNVFGHLEAHDEHWFDNNWGYHTLMAARMCAGDFKLPQYIDYEDV